VVRGFGPAHSLLEASPLALAAWLASRPRFGRRVRAALATFGLLTASAVLVHLSEGRIEFHFHFFVMLFVITFYQDWATFLLAIAYVGVDHGVVGLLAPQAVYNHAEAWRSPLKWAGVHALFVAGASVAAVANWRLTEKAQAGERALADKLAYHASHDPLPGVLNRREFERCLTEALARSGTQHQEHVLCLLDLDRFKIVNDTCGHVAGDHLLRQLTGLLQAGASIGVVAVTPFTASVEEVMQAADAACYTAQGQGAELGPPVPARRRRAQPPPGRVPLGRADPRGHP
jgi:GGDEF domain-containing protein